MQFCLMRALRTPEVDKPNCPDLTISQMILASEDVGYDVLNIL